MALEISKKLPAIWTRPNIGLSPSVDDARATAGCRKRGDKKLVNSLSVQFLSIRLVCLVGKPAVHLALPNGPSSPAPCDIFTTKLLQFEKATRPWKMRLNQNFSLGTRKTT